VCPGERGGGRRQAGAASGYAHIGQTAVIGLLQRVVEASVDIGTQRVASIGPGLVVLVGVRPDDDESSALRLLNRLLQYRVFADEAGKMNLSLGQVQGHLLLVPQFTLAAETHKGLRPGFSTAAPSDLGRHLFDTLVQAARAQHGHVQTGVFGAHMRVSLTNDGPVTFWLES
jgi:D-tyrosyl-tRNA(Tyr) deacylase